MRVPQTTARAVGVEIPAATTDHTLVPGRRPVRIDAVGGGVAIRSVPIRRPLPDVAVHVAESPRIQREAANQRRLLSIVSWRGGAVRKLAVVVRLRRAQ